MIPSNITLTYNDLVEKVITYIENNCANLSDSKYNTIPPCFKVGYTQTMEQPHDWVAVEPMREEIPYIPIIKCLLLGKSLQKATNTVRNDLVTYLNSVKLTSTVLSNKVSNNGIVDFIHHILNFLYAKLEVYSSIFSENKYLCYINSNELLDGKSFPDFISNYQITLSPTMNLLNSILFNMNSSLKNFVIQYQYIYVSDYDSDLDISFDGKIIFESGDPAKSNTVITIEEDGVYELVIIGGSGGSGSGGFKTKGSATEPYSGSVLPIIGGHL